MREKIKRKKNLRKNQKFEKVFIIIVVVVSIVLGIGSFFLFQQINSSYKYLSPLANSSSMTDESREVKKSQVEELLLKQKIKFDSVSASSSAIIVQFEDDSVAILSTKKEMKKQISSLQFILTRLTMEGRSFTRLDMRFDKPVIR